MPHYKTFHLEGCPERTLCTQCAEQPEITVYMARPKQRKPISTDVNDTLDDCYNDVPDDLLVSMVQISAGKSKLLTLTLYYTTGTIMLQGRACRKWVDQEFSDTDSPSTPSTSCGCRL